MTYNEVMNQLESLGTAQNRKIYSRHGCDINQFGVSIANLKKVLKPIKKDKELGKKLLFSNNADAIYLSQWIVDIDELTIDDFEALILSTNYYMLIENAFPSIIVKDKGKSVDGLRRWIEHDEPRLRQAAYALYSNYISFLDDSELDIQDLSNILEYIKDNIHSEENRVRYVMNNFVIAVGTFVKELTEQAKEVARVIDKVEVYMGETSCKVPYAIEYIEKVESMNRVGKKRK